MAQSLRILITNIVMDSPSGTVLYTRDLALELQRLGHRPMVHTWYPGSVSDELTSAGIEVYTDLRQCRIPPDIIHGHHHSLVRGALWHFPHTPALFLCHDHTAASDRTLLHPNILRYIGVSQLCLNRLLQGGSPPVSTLLRYNFVDIERFSPRAPLPEKPRKALIFSNYARLNTQVPAVTQACRNLGLELDLIGSGMGKGIRRPETRLGEYDLVFAKAKAAIEAMAVGNAVVLCDFGGVGPMVSSENFDRLRPLNFGFQSLTEPLSPEALERQIRRYDAQDAVRVRDRIRTEASLSQAANDWVDLYRQLISEFATTSGSSRIQTLGRLPRIWQYAIHSRASSRYLRLRIAYAEPRSGWGKRLFRIGRFFYRRLRPKHRP